MDKIKKLIRYWVDKDSKTIIRKWTDEEYKNHDPHEHIFEKYWCYHCPTCGFISMPYCRRSIAGLSAGTHEMHTDKEHKCIVKQKNYELICFEYKYGFMEDLNAWTSKKEYYIN